MLPVNLYGTIAKLGEENRRIRKENEAKEAENRQKELVEIQKKVRSSHYFNDKYLEERGEQTLVNGKPVKDGE